MKSSETITKQSSTSALHVRHEPLACFSTCVTQNCANVPAAHTSKSSSGEPQQGGDSPTETMGRN